MYGGLQAHGLQIAAVNGTLALKADTATVDALRLALRLNVLTLSEQGRLVVDGFVESVKSVIVSPGLTFSKVFNAPEDPTDGDESTLWIAPYTPARM